MKFRDAEHPDGAAKVTELHLSRNQLTVQSLEKLGEVIALSAGDMREFDLSRNRIEVCDDEQKELWFGFLVKFDRCYVLKKIDLGHNNLGIKGVEMLARAYLRSELDFVEGEVEELGTNGEEEDGTTVVDGVALKVNGHKENGNPGRSRSKRSPGKGKAKQNGKKNPHTHFDIYHWTNMMFLVGNSGAGSSSTGKSLSPADLKRFACTRGLRSVPFIILSSTSMTTGAAVHLASMILAHRGPEHLLAYLPGGKTPSLPDVEGRCNGLLWLPNDNLSDLGHKMLDSAETLREFTSEMNPEEDQLHREGKLPRDLEGVNLVDLMEQRRQHTKLNTEFTRVAKRARLEALRTEGVHAAQMWSAALRMIVVARTVLLDSAKRDAADEHTEPENEHEVQAQSQATAVESARAPVSDQGQNGELTTFSSPKNVSNGSASISTQSEGPVQSQPAAFSSNSAFLSSHGKRYVPFNYHSEQELSLPSYPIIPGSMQTALSDLPNDSPPDSSVANEPSFLNTTSGVRCEMNGYSTAAHTGLENGSTLVQSGLFQPGAAEFEANFPALDTSNNKGPPVVAQQTIEKKPATTPPQRKYQHQSGQGQGQSGNAQRKANARQSAPGLEQKQKQPEEKKHEERDWRYEFPMQVWRKIIAHSVDADGVLSRAQQERIIQYATDWKSIGAELRSQGAEKHQQVWKLLDTVNSFTYDCLP